MRISVCIDDFVQFARAVDPTPTNLSYFVANLDLFPLSFSNLLNVSFFVIPYLNDLDFMILFQDLIYTICWDAILWFTRSHVFKIFIVETSLICGNFVAETQIWIRPEINGVPPCPRDSHSCTTVGDNLFVFGGTDGTKYLNDVHILDTCKLFHRFFCYPVRLKKCLC